MSDPRPPARVDGVPPGFSDPEGLAHPATHRQAVAWGELDALGHVNHTVFLRWLENARFGWFERVGLRALAEQSEGAMGPILARLSCDYRAPVHFPDTVWVSCACRRLGGSSLGLVSQVWSQVQARVVAEAEVVVVWVDTGSGRPARVPEPIRAAIRALDYALLSEERVEASDEGELD